jgi:hypothetical protein
VDIPMINQIRVGMDVRTLEGEPLGHVTEVGSATFQVETGLLFKRTFAMSFEEIVWIGDGRVVLTVSREELEAIRGGGEIGTTLSERVAGAVDHARLALEAAVHPAHTPREEDLRRR